MKSVKAKKVDTFDSNHCSTTEHIVRKVNRRSDLGELILKFVPGKKK